MKKLIHVLDKDKRKRKRVELFSNLPARIEALGRSVTAKIKDVSYNGIGIILSPNQDFPTMQSLETKIELPNQLFQGKIANKIILPNQEIKIGLELPPESNKEIDFNNTDSTWDRVTDVETIQNIYRDLIIKGYESRIEIRQNFSRGYLIPIELINMDTMICEASEIIQGVFEKGKAKCAFDLFNTCHAFDTNIEKIDEKKFELKLSTSLARLLRRETVRIQKNNAKFQLKVRLTNHELQTTIEEYEVFDYSEHGISMLDPEGELSLPRNLVFNEVIIEIQGLGTIEGTAEVRSYQWNRDLNSYIVGLKFDPAKEPNLTNWHNLVLKARYPSLDFSYHDSDHQKIWDLFDISGYTAKKNDSKHDFIFNKTKKTWFDLSLVGTEFSKRIMLRDGDHIVGHMQIDKIYSKTWCVHHLAINPKVSKMVAKDLYSVTTDILLAENAKFLLNFTDADKPWNQRSYYDFIENYRFKDHNELKRFQVYLNNNFVFKNENSLKIREANKYDLKKIIKYFESNLSELEREACSLDEEIFLKELSEQYAKHNLKRSRKFFVAYDQNNETVGFSRIELGDEGVNIFNSLNMFYVYIFNKNTVNQYAIDFLISESLKFYEEQNIADVLITLDDNNIDYYKKVGLKLFSDAVRWIALKDILPRYHAFCQLLYGHLVLKREKIRKNITENE